MKRTSHPLVGRTILDSGVVGGKSGTIVAVGDDGTVDVTWKGRIGVCSIRPTAGRYGVVMS